MPPTSITGRTKLLGVLADPVAQARSPGMANVLLEQQGLFGDYVLVPLHVSAAGLNNLWVPEICEKSKRGAL